MATASKWFFGGYTQEEIALLQVTFTKLRAHLQDIGLAAFTRLYDENKEAFDVFVTNNLLPVSRDSIGTSTQARQHCIRVMSAVELCASKLDNEQAIIDYVRALAGRHCGFGIKADHFLSLFGCLRVALFDELVKVNQSIRSHGACCYRPSTHSEPGFNMNSVSTALDSVCPVVAMRHSCTAAVPAPRPPPRTGLDSSDTSGCLTDDEDLSSSTHLNVQGAVASWPTEQRQQPPLASALAMSPRIGHRPHHHGGHHHGHHHNKVQHHVAFSNAENPIILATPPVPKAPLSPKPSSPKAALQAVLRGKTSNESSNNVTSSASPVVAGNTASINNCYLGAITKEELAVWNKFFLTLSLALINSVEVAMADRQKAYVSKKAKARANVKTNGPNGYRHPGRRSISKH